MTEEEARDLVIRKLFEVAPDLEGEEVDPSQTFRDQFGIDSMDFLNLVIALAEETSLEIPERDYPRLASLSGAAAYLAGHTSAARAG